MRPSHYALVLLSLLALAPTSAAQFQGYINATDDAFADLGYGTGNPSARAVSPLASGKFLGNASAYFVDPHPYNGFLPSAANGYEWSAMQYQLWSGVSGVHPVPSPTSIAADAQAHVAAGRVPFSLTYWRYDYIDPDAETDGRIELTSDGFARPRNPDGTLVNPAPLYVERTLFTAGVPMAAGLTVGRTTSFVFDHKMVSLMPGASYSNVEVDFGDGNGFRSVSPGAPFSVTFPATGKREFTLRAAVADGPSALTLTARGTIHVVEGTGPQTKYAAARTGTPDCDEDQEQGVDAPDILSSWRQSTESYYGTGAEDPVYNGDLTAGYQYGIYFANGSDGALRNPVIIVDGYDSDENRCVQGIYGLVNFTPDGSPGFGDTLREQGYDVVIFDYQDSKDFLQRNGLALRDLINTINAQVVGNDPGIRGVIGSSMGGLISRYTLAYMEAQGEPHNVRTFVSYDSPQQGGNIPLGLQHQIEDLEVIDITGKASKIVRDFRSPGTRQLLTSNTTHGIADPLRDQFFADLLALGDYPSRTWNVAVANGSGTGLRQLVELNQPDRLGQGDPLAEVGFQGGIVGFGGSYTTQSYAVSTSYPRKVAENVTRGCLPLAGCSIVLDRNERFAPSGTIPYDNAPGGWRASAPELDVNTPSIIAAEFAVFIGSYLLFGVPITADFYSTIQADLHAFIPTTSAIDLNPSSTSRSGFVSGNFQGQTPYRDISTYTQAELEARTPFDKVFVPGLAGEPDPSNQRHIAGTPGIAGFILTQLSYGSQFLIVDQDGTLPGDYTFTELRQVIVTDGVTATFTGSVTAAAGAKFNLGAGASVELAGPVSLTGTGHSLAAGVQIRSFGSNGPWTRLEVSSDGAAFDYVTVSGGADGLLITGDGASVNRSVFDGGEVGLEARGAPNAPEAITIRNSSIHGTRYGLLIDNVDATVEGNDIHGGACEPDPPDPAENCYGLTLRHSRSSVRDNLVRGWGTGVYLDGNARLEPFHDNTVVRNHNGISIYGGAHLRDFEGNQLGGGDFGSNGNTLYGVYLASTASRAWLTNTDSYQRGGFSNIIPSYPTAARAVYNLAKSSSGEQYVDWTVTAWRNFWGRPDPSPYSFHGAVDYAYPLASEAGAGSQHLRAAPQMGRPKTVLTANQARTALDRGGKEALEVAQVVLDLQQAMALVTGPERVRLLHTLYGYMQWDERDAAQTHALTRTLIAEARTAYDLLRRGLPTLLPAETVRLSGQTLVVLEVYERLHDGDPAGAQALLHEYGDEIDNADLQTDVLLATAYAAEAAGDARAALVALNAAEALGPDADMDNEHYVAPDYGPFRYALARGSAPAPAPAPAFRPAAGPAQRAAGSPVAFDVEVSGSNPFRSRTRFRVVTPEPGPLKAEVYDTSGRRLVVLAEGDREAGSHEFLVDGANLAAGLYLVRVQAGGEVRTLTLTRAR